MIKTNVKLVTRDPQTGNVAKDGYAMYTLKKNIPEDGIPRQAAIDMIKASLPNYYTLGKIYSLSIVKMENVVAFSPDHVPFIVEAEFEVIYDCEAAAKGSLPFFLVPINEITNKNQMVLDFGV